MRKVLAITNALADESRLRALIALTRGQLCVCQIAELLQLAPSTVSKHLSILRYAGLVESRKKGRWMYYSIPNQLDSLVHQSLEWMRDALRDAPRIVEDAKRLKAVLKEDPEELCRRQMGKSKSCSSARATPAEAKWRKVGRAGSKAK